VVRGTSLVVGGPTVHDGWGLVETGRFEGWRGGGVTQIGGGVGTLRDAYCLHCAVQE